MNEFVDECRNAWKRLGVPDTIANEMATDLAADLDEAAAEGAAPEDVLGAGAFDAAAFAAAWATERGVIGETPAPLTSRRRSRIPVAIAILALLAIVGAVLVIVATPSTDTPLPLPRILAPPAATRDVVVSPDGGAVWVPSTSVPGGMFVTLNTDGSGDNARIVGSVLLGVALAAILLVTLAWWWRSPDRRPSGHAY